MNQVYIGNKVGGFRVHSGEIVFPYFVGAIGEGGLCGVAIYSAHMLLSGFSFDQLRGHALRRSVGDAFIANARANSSKSESEGILLRSEC